MPNPKRARLFLLLTCHGLFASESRGVNSAWIDANIHVAIGKVSFTEEKLLKICRL